MNPFDAESCYDDDEKQLRNLDPAWAKAAHFFRTGDRFGHRDGIRLRSLLDVHAEVEARRKRYEAGDTMELLHAVKVCAEENLPLPEWLALAFNERFTSIGKVGGPTSLDEVFYSSRLPTTGKKAAQARRDWQIGAKLWREVWKVAADHAGLDTAITAVLASGRHGVGKTKARQLVEMIDDTQSALTGQQSLSHFWSKRRKR